MKGLLRNEKLLLTFSSENLIFRTGILCNKKTAGHNLPALKKERVKSFSAQHNSLISVEDQADGMVLPTVK